MDGDTTGLGGHKTVSVPPSTWEVESLQVVSSLRLRHQRSVRVNRGPKFSVTLKDVIGRFKI